MAKIGNIFDSAVQAREQEQAKVTAAVTGAAVEKAAKTQITLSITQEDSEKVKIFALKNHTTVSDLLHEWIVEKCGE